MADPIDLKKHIRSIPDFPKPGILFYDISTLLAHPKAWHETIEQLAAAIRPYKPDVLAGIESRGFLLAAPIAHALGKEILRQRKTGLDIVGGTSALPLQQRMFPTGVATMSRTAVLAGGATGGVTAGPGTLPTLVSSTLRATPTRP